MANSSYYYGQYKAHKKKVNVLNSNIFNLLSIKNSLEVDFHDEQSSVNKELDDLKDDLNKAVRHDYKFANIASQSNSYKEKGSTADVNLNSGICALENEIATLNNQKLTANNNMNQNYQMYLTKKEEERQAWLESINIFG